MGVSVRISKKIINVFDMQFSSYGYFMRSNMSLAELNLVKRQSFHLISLSATRAAHFAIFPSNLAVF